MSKATTATPGEMRDMDIRFISLVHKGANRQTIQIYKADEEGEGEHEPETAPPPAAPVKKSLWDRIVETLSASPANADDIEKADEKPATLKTFSARIAVKDLSEKLWTINSTFADTLRDIVSDAGITDKKAAVNQAIDEYATYLKARMGDVVSVKKADDPFFAEPVTVSKAGRRLSAKTETALRAAVDALNGVLNAAKEDKPDDGENADADTITKEEIDMNKEDITKMMTEAITEAIKPLTERVDKLEKADAPADTGADGTEADVQKSDDIKDIIKAAVDEAIAPLTQRVETVEKARGLGRSEAADDAGKSSVDKAADDIFEGYFA